MILIGNDIVSYENIANVSDIEQISNTQPNSTLLFEFNSDLMHYCNQNSLAFGVKVKSLKEAILANALSAKYIICENELSQVVQKSAENYMFDAKILEIIDNDDAIEAVALRQIDGVIYKKVL